MNFSDPIRIIFLPSRIFWRKITSYLIEMMDLASDRILLDRAYRFENDALTEIFDRYNARIYAYAYRQLGDQDLARECMSETFARFLKALNRGIGPNNHLQAYLFKIAHNWITDYFRSTPWRTVSLDPELHVDPYDEPSQIAGQKIAIEKIRNALADLTPEQRQVISLRFLEGWEHNEIAETMNKPVGAVKSLQNRAIASLRRLLSQQTESAYE